MTWGYMEQPRSLKLIFEIGEEDDQSIGVGQLKSCPQG